MKNLKSCAHLISILITWCTLIYTQEPQAKRQKKAPQETAQLALTYAQTAEDIAHAIQKGTCLYQQDKSGKTALHQAITRNDQKTIAALLAYEARTIPQSQRKFFSTGDNKGIRPLHFAAQIGHLECLKLLLHHAPHININVYNTPQSMYEHYTPLYMACHFLHNDIVEYLLTQEGILTYSLGNNNRITALHCTCLELPHEITSITHQQRAKIAKMLLDHDQKNGNELITKTYGDTCTSALDIACKNRNKELTHLLMSHAAHKAAMPCYHYAQHYLQDQKQKTTQAWLKKQFPQNDHLDHAQAQLFNAQTGNDIHQAVAQGADINTPLKKNGLTPLQHACSQGNPDTVKALISYKTIVIEGNQNPTPLYILCDPAYKHAENQYIIIKYLLAAGASVYTPYLRPDTTLLTISTPYTRALENTSPKVIKIILHKNNGNLIKLLPKTTISIQACRVILNMHYKEIQQRIPKLYENNLFLQECFVLGSEELATNLDNNKIAFKDNQTLLTRQALKTMINLSLLDTHTKNHTLTRELQADIFSYRSTTLQKIMTLIHTLEIVHQNTIASYHAPGNSLYDMLSYFPAAHNDHAHAIKSILQQIATLTSQAHLYHESFFILFSLFKTTKKDFSFFYTQLIEEEYDFLQKKFSTFSMQKALLKQHYKKQNCDAILHCHFEYAS